MIEVVATIVILGVLGSIASSTMMTATDGYLRASTQAQLHSELSMALDRIERGLRKITMKSDFGDPAPNITELTASSLTWNSGLFSVRQIGNQLQVVENGTAAATLLHDVSSVVMQGYDESNAPLAASLSGAQCDPVRRISIEVTLQRNGISESLRTKVYLRCTMRGAES